MRVDQPLSSCVGIIERLLLVSDGKWRFCCWQRGNNNKNADLEFDAVPELPRWARMWVKSAPCINEKMRRDAKQWRAEKRNCREITQFPLISHGAAVISSASFNYRGRNWATAKINSAEHMSSFLIRAALICEQSCSEKCGMTYWLTAGTRGPCKLRRLNLGLLYQSLQALVLASIFIGAHSASLPEWRNEEAGLSPAA